MQLLYSNPLPSPEFVSLSLLMQPDPDEPTGGGFGEPLLLASPLSTISHGDAIATLKELHKYLTALLTLDEVHENPDATIYDRIVADLFSDDENLLDNNKMQVFRPLQAHGLGMHYRLLRDDKTKGDFASLILASSRATGSTASETDHRKIEKKTLGVLLCVGMSGIPYAHCSSSLQYGLATRMNDCVGILSKRIGSVDVGAARTILSTLLATEDEVRKTAVVAASANVTAIPTLEATGHGIKKPSALKSLLNKGSGEAYIHVALSDLSNDNARNLIERLNVLSVADSDSLLRPYETSGQQRKANLDLTGNKSRFRKRKADTTTNADLDNFDYKGPVRERKPNRVKQRSPLRASAPGAFPFSPQSSTRSESAKSVASAKSHGLRQHKADAQPSRRNRAVPTLSAPRADVSSSRRSSNARGDEEDDTRSRRSAKSHGSNGRRNTGDTTSSANWTDATEDMSETSRSMGSGSLARIQVNIALNEDLTCSYKFSKMTSCSVEGVIQVQVKSNSRSSVPFQLSVRDPSQHIQTLQENRKFAEDTSASQLSRDMVERGDRSFTIGVPRADNYFPLIRYKCSSELRPVPIRVQTRVKVDAGYCRVALQISSNPHNEGSLTDLTIIMGVANDIRGESLVTQPAGGVWNASKRSVIWCVSELGDGEKFQLQARFEMDEDNAYVKGEQETPKFPVLVRCQCMYAQLSDVEVAVQDIPELQAAEVAMKVARRFRLSHQERS